MLNKCNISNMETTDNKSNNLQVKQIAFRGLRIMTETEAEKLRVPRSADLDFSHENSILDDIFAPDPVTGNPNSDLFIRLKGDPTMREYIDKYLSNPVPSVAKIDEENKDMALQFTKSKYESANEYLSRIQRYQQESAGK